MSVSNSQGAALRYSVGLGACAVYENGKENEQLAMQEVISNNEHLPVFLYISAWWCHPSYVAYVNLESWETISVNKSDYTRWRW